MTSMPINSGRLAGTKAVALALCLLAALASASPAQRRPPASPSQPPPLGTPVPGTKIIAVVNGDVITSGDVENRAKLFALSTGLSVTPEVIDRLRTQIANQLIDERLRLQETQ